MRPVQPAPGDQPHRLPVPERQRPVPVELDLVQPVAALRRPLHRRSQLRRQPLRPRPLHRPRQRPGLSRPTFAGAAGASSSIRRPRLHALRPLGEDVAPRRRRRVLLLDQQPDRLLLPRLRLQPHQHPPAAELLPRQPELQLPRLQPGVRVPHRRPGPGVPDDHRPAAILPLGDHRLEVDILDRMVLGLHRQPPVRRIERRPLRHRPALQHPAQLQPAGRSGPPSPDACAPRTGCPPPAAPPAGSAVREKSRFAR